MLNNINMSQDESYYYYSGYYHDYYSKNDDEAGAASNGSARGQIPRGHQTQILTQHPQC